MAQYYHEQAGNGDPCNGTRRMFIYLYPNTSDELEYTKSPSPIVEGLASAGDQLYSHNACTYFQVARFHSEKSGYNYPEVSKDNIETEFQEFLQNEEDSENGTGSDLYSTRGCHLLVHDFGCNTSLASGEAGTDKCEWDNGGAAWSRGCMAWTSATCSRDYDNLQARNSAIQEALHYFIRGCEDSIESAYDLEGCDTHCVGAEHALGKITEGNLAPDEKATPLLTYHEDENANCGKCKSSESWDNNYMAYTDQLTSCTKDAIADTGNDQCNPQKKWWC